MEAHGQLMLSTNVRLPETKYKRLQITFFVTSIAFIIVHICTELLQLSAQSLIGSPGTLATIGLGRCSNLVKNMLKYFFAPFEKFWCSREEEARPWGDNRKAYWEKSSANHIAWINVV